MKHEKTYASILIMFFGIQAYAQTYTDSFDSVFRNVSRAEASTGILYERVLPFANLTNYNSNEQQPDTSNSNHFLQAYYEIHQATFRFSTPLPAYDSVESMANSNTLTGGGGGTPANRIGGGFSNSGFITLISANADGCSGGGQPTKGGDGTQESAPLGDFQQYLNLKGTAASVTDAAGHQSLESEMAVLSAKALNRLTSGTDSWRMDSLKMWYNAIEYPYAKYALAELHAACGETAKADSIIAALPDMTVLSEDGYDEYASYLQYYSLYRTLGLSGRTWADMTDGETQSLKMIAEQGFGKAKARAGFILCFFGVECHTDGDGTQQQEDTEAVENAVTTTLQGTVTEHGQAEHRPARVYPNPNDGNLTVEADGTVEVTIYSVSGMKLAGKRIDGTATLDLSGLATGIYFYEIRTDNGTVYGKLMKK